MNATPGAAARSSASSSGKWVQALTITSISLPRSCPNRPPSSRLTAPGGGAVPASAASAISTSAAEPWRTTAQSAAKRAARSST